MVENEMQKADSSARRNRTGLAADQMANAARLGVLEKHLQIPIKRYRDPGNVPGSGLDNIFVDEEKNKEDHVVRVSTESG